MHHRTLVTVGQGKVVVNRADREGADRIVAETSAVAHPTAKGTRAIGRKSFPPPTSTSMQRTLCAP